MLVKEVTASRSVRINIGNFEGVELFLSARAEYDENFDGTFDEAQHRLGNQLNSSLHFQVMAILHARGQKVSSAEVTKRYGLLP